MDTTKISPNLPQEICAIISQDPCLQTPDLHSLCLVSRPFHAEAERILYVDVCVKGTRHIKSFCNSVVRRPYIALRVKKMRLYMPPHLLDLTVDDISKMVRAFRATSNLEDLQILEEDATNDPVYSTYGWVLEDHFFHLKSFTNTYFDTNSLLKFLMQQPTIGTLTTKSRDFTSMIPYRIDFDMSRIHTLHGSAFMIQAIAMSAWPNNIVRMHIDFTDCVDEDELKTLVSLMKFRSSLQSLSVERRDADLGLDITLFTSCITTQMPDLKYLRIMDYTETEETYYSPLVVLLLSLVKIETLIIHPPRVIYTKNGKQYKTSSFMDLRTSFGRLTTASTLMRRFPTLKRFVLIGRYPYVYKRNADGRAKLARSSELPDDDEWMRI